MCSAALCTSIAEDFFIFAFVALCGALQAHFHGRGRNGKRQLQRRFLRKRGATGKCCWSAPSQSSPVGLASSPKGRAKSTAGNFIIMPNTLAKTLDLGSPFGGAGAGAPERACSPEKGGLWHSGKASRHACKAHHFFSPQCFNLRYSAGATRCTAA